MPKVYVTDKIPEEGLTLLRQKGFSVEVNESGKDLTNEELKNVFKIYDAVITLVSNEINSDIISTASSNLKIISNYGVGFDNIDVLAANKRNINVTNTPGVASESVAEFTFALILACAKHITSADKYVREGNYKRWEPLIYLSPQLWGKTIGIVGLGKIGTFVGQMAYGGFKMKILYQDKIKAEDFELLTEAEAVSLDKLLRQADVITLHVPLTDETRHLIGKEEFAKMKSTAIFINTSRGPVVDEKALIQALKEKKIAAAGIDVYEHEPRVSEDLLNLTNAVLAPHIASATIETRVSMSKIAAQNIIDVFDGKKPDGFVRI